MESQVKKENRKGNLKRYKNKKHVGEDIIMGDFLKNRIPAKRGQEAKNVSD